MKAEEKIPEAAAGSKCAWCPNIHRQPLSGGTGICALTGYKNGAHWVLICQTCAHGVAQKIIEAPVSGPPVRKSRAKLDKRYVQERLL